MLSQRSCTVGDTAAILEDSGFSAKSGSGPATASRSFEPMLITSVSRGRTSDRPFQYLKASSQHKYFGAVLFVQGQKKRTPTS
jgi:hypothetical protein